MQFNNNGVLTIAIVGVALATGSAIHYLNSTMKPPVVDSVCVAAVDFGGVMYNVDSDYPTSSREVTSDNHYGPAPLYKYVEDSFIKTYDRDIQEEIWRQYNEFEGDLPPYEMVLSLWISESNLNPWAVNYNDNGTVDYGIAQLNTVTIQECARKGWYNWETDDIDDYRTQIRLGLQVLNYFCEAAPGGDWPYYRAIRAYQLGVGGLEYRESIGDFGSNDTWYEGPNGQWYPGKYGKVKSIQRHLELTD